jgi:hypothetical protein
MCKKIFTLLMSVQLLMISNVYAYERVNSSRLVGYAHTEILKANTQSYIEDLRKIKTWEELNQLVQKLNDENAQNVLSDKIKTHKHLEFQLPSMTVGEIGIDITLIGVHGHLSFFNDKISFNGKELEMKGKSIDKMVHWLFPGKKVSLFSLFVPDAEALVVEAGAMVLVGVLFVSMYQYLKAERCDQQKRLSLTLERAQDWLSKCHASLESKTVNYDLEVLLKELKNRSINKYAIFGSDVISSKVEYTCMEYLQWIHKDFQCKIFGGDITEAQVCKQLDDTTTCLLKLEKSRAAANQSRDAGKDVDSNAREQVTPQAGGAISN